MACEPEPGSLELHCEVRQDVLAHPNPTLDVLFVIDDSPAMAAHQTALATNLRRWVNVLDNIEGGLPSVHIGVVSADPNKGGRLLNAPTSSGCPTPTGSFVVDHSDPWWMCGSDSSARCGEKNYDAGLGDVLGCIGELGASGPATQQPLAMAVKALDGSVPANSGFLRAEADLFIVVVGASDDHSPGSVASYAEQLAALADGDRWMSVATVAPEGAPRIEALADELAGSKISIDAADWSDALATAASWYAQVLALSCIEGADPTDVEISEPGLQLSCVASSMDERTGVAEIVEPCQMAADGQPAPQTPLPCYWIEAAPASNGCEHRPIFEGAERWRRYEVRCVGTCE